MKCERFATLSRGIMMVLFFGLLGCQEEILHDLDELHANQVELLLANEGLDVQKSKSGTVWNISVSRGEKIQALSALEKSRILTRELSRFQEQGQGLLQTREEKRAAVEREVGRALEKTLESLPGVLEARVHFFLPEFDVLALQTKDSPGSASVLLIAKNSVAVDEGQVRQIVAGARGLSPTNISVVLSRAENDEFLSLGLSQAPEVAQSMTFVYRQFPKPLAWLLLVFSSALLLVRGQKILIHRQDNAKRGSDEESKKSELEKLAPRRVEPAQPNNMEVF